MKIKAKDIYIHIFLSSLTGLIAFLSFPKIDLFFLIWIAFIPLIYLSLKLSFKQSLFYGLLSGFVFNAASMYWLTIMLEFNTKSLFSAIGISFLLWIYLALYWGLWALLLNVSSKIINSKYILCFVAASLWIVLEFIRTYFLTGFPWLLLGYSQYKFSEIIQIAEFGGVYAVSFIIILCNMFFYYWLIERGGKKYSFSAIIIIIVCALFGAVRLDAFKFLGKQEFNAVIIQPSIDQYKKWDSAYGKEISASLNNFAETISKRDFDLVIWPETVIPHFISSLPESYIDVQNLAKKAGGFHILGVPFVDESNNYSNIVIAIEKGKENFEFHKKNHLVPFGEYVPFRNILSKFVGVLNDLGDFEKGFDANIFSNGQIYVGALICSENFFPDITRRLVLNGAQVLANLTNDAWFFDTAAPYQHFIMNVFRAVESRKTVLVSANSGVSGIVEASGRIIAISPIFESGLIEGSFLQNDFKSFYVKYGDVFMRINIVFLLIMLIIFPIFIKYRKDIFDKDILKWVKNKIIQRQK